LQCAGGSWLTTVRQNSNVTVEIFDVFHQTLFIVGTHADTSPMMQMINNAAGELLFFTRH